MRALPLLLFLALVASCSNRLAKEKAEEMKKAVCACADRACAEEHLQAFRDWFFRETPRGTRDDAEAVSRAYIDAESCLQKLGTTRL
jgi:hypothetical protein